MWTDGQGKKLKEEGDENNEKFPPLSFSVIELLVVSLIIIIIIYLSFQRSTRVDIEFVNTLQ